MSEVYVYIVPCIWLHAHHVHPVSYPMSTCPPYTYVHNVMSACPLCILLCFYMSTVYLTPCLNVHCVYYSMFTWPLCVFLCIYMSTVNTTSCLRVHVYNTPMSKCPPRLNVYWVYFFMSACPLCILRYVYMSAVYMLCVHMLSGPPRILFCFHMPAVYVYINPCMWIFFHHVHLGYYSISTCPPCISFYVNKFTVYITVW